MFTRACDRQNYTLQGHRVDCTRQQTSPAAYLIAPLLPAPPETSIVLVKRSKDRDAGYNPLTEADVLRRFYGRCVTTARTASGRCDEGLVWGLVGTGIDENAIMPVERITIPDSGHPKLTGSLGEVCSEVIHAR